jgi:hypothetical protein
LASKNWTAAGSTAAEAAFDGGGSAARPAAVAIPSKPISIMFEWRIILFSAGGRYPRGERSRFAIR